MVDRNFQFDRLSLEHFKCKYKQFPGEFMLGTASSAYQIEGAWNDDGKTESIWDRIAHTKQELFMDELESDANFPKVDMISENSFLCISKGIPMYNKVNHKQGRTIITGDIACNSYYKIDEDVELLKELKVQSYRFSLSWPRILPRGEDSYINPAGIQYYNRLIDKLIENNITPVVTIYHWDLPQCIQDLGGWCNKQIVEFFTLYVRIVFRTFGDRVKYWITINEPYLVSESYGNVSGAPALSKSGFGDYLAIHHTILAHAAAYHIYNREFRPLQNGQIGISLNMEWYFPKNISSLEDHYAAHRARMWQFGVFAHPLFFGDYPEDVKQGVMEINKSNGISMKRLLDFSENERHKIKGTLDFLGINHYFSVYATKLQSTQNQPLKTLDSNFELSLIKEFPYSNPMWIKETPKGMRSLLCWIRDTYGNPKIIITENGVSNKRRNEDEDTFIKIRYHYGYLSAVLNAIYEDGCNVIGYEVWSFLDSFEWFFGYREKFGIYKVDFNDQNRSRYPKKSLQFFKQLFQTKTLPDVLDDLYCENNSIAK
ncbi:myrosinase 1-like isoform X2 [Rhopalosiphum maidis]|uniref:myrosinase 1-like isoform X2 n=1 Tax=Rhopalosiphum maidis TaxID=43146 RepID=UPI000EFF81E2|nr:myrosinase 1-like isoform X2 [Rhopalosiphum maidis]